MRRTFTFEGNAIITFKPNHLGAVHRSEEIEVFLHRNGWVDVRGRDGKLTTIPREEVAEIEWVPDA